MKYLKSRTLTMIMIMVLVLSSFSLSFAEKGYNGKSDKSNKPDKVSKEVEKEKENDEDEIDLDIEDENEESSNEDQDEDQDEIKGVKVKANKKAKDKAKDIEERLEDIEGALDGENLTEDQKLALRAMKDEAKAMRQQAKEIRKELRERIKKAYSQEELDEIIALTEELREQYEGIKILPVDSIISSRAQFKFDLPPVIKEGRTLIPVRAITEGFGAEVQWNQETQKVTITKGEDVIVIVVGENIAYVNGEETVLDAKAEVISSRTVVPLRFIAETFGLDVEWNEDDESIEIEDEDESEDKTTDE